MYPSRMPETATNGSLLREARIERGMSLAEVAARTNIRVEHLRRLEAGRTEPDPAYSRAFARAYAAELGIDPETLLSGFEPVPAVSAGDAQDPITRDRAPTAAGHPWPSTLRLLAPVILIVAGVLVVTLLLAGGDPPADSGDEPAAEPRRERRGVAALPTPSQEFSFPTAPAPNEAALEAPGLRVSSASGVALCVLEAGKPSAVEGKLAAGEAKTIPGADFVLVFPLGFDPGDLRATLDGEKITFIDTQGPAAARITRPGQAQVVPLPGAPCG